MSILFLMHGNIKLTSYEGNGGDITVPSFINGRKVTMIGHRCFNGDHNNTNNLTSVIIPEGIKSLDADAFIYCDNLVNVQLPRSVSGVRSWFFCCPQVKIKVYPGSKAYNYITEIDNNVTYQLIGVTDLSKGKVSKLNSTYTYTGKAIKPNVVVKYGSYILRKNIDYTVTYKDNNKVGKAQITIKGKKLFCGTHH